MVAFGEASGGGRRSRKREAAPLSALITTRFHSQGGTLVDISATGARIRGSGLPDVGRHVVLGVEALRMFGTVRWHSASDCGIEFDTPLRAIEVAWLRREIARGVGLPCDMRAAVDDWVLGTAR